MGCRGRTRPRVDDPEAVRELGCDPGLAAHGAGREQRRTRADVPDRAGDDAALSVQGDQRGVPELADEPAVPGADEVEGGRAGVPPGDHRRAGQVDDRDPAVAAQGDVCGVAVRAEADAVWGSADFDGGTDLEGAGWRDGRPAGRGDDSQGHEDRRHAERARPEYRGTVDGRVHSVLFSVSGPR